MKAWPFILAATLSAVGALGSLDHSVGAQEAFYSCRSKAVFSVFSFPVSRSDSMEYPDDPLDECQDETNIPSRNTNAVPFRDHPGKRTAFSLSMPLPVCGFGLALASNQRCYRKYYLCYNHHFK